jgi:Flp pilus assembly protein TadG
MKNMHFQRGSSLPETAIAMAAVLAILFGIIDFGRAMYTYGFVATMAREGARWAIVRGSESCTNSPSLPDCGATKAEIVSYVQGLSEGATVASSINVTPSWPGTGCTGSTLNAPGCNVIVQVSYPFKFLALPFFPKAGITMTSTSEMVISQ